MKTWSQFKTEVLGESNFPDKYDHIASVTSDGQAERTRELHKDDQKKVKDFVKSKHWKEVDKRHTEYGEKMAGDHVDDDFHGAFKKWHKETHGTEHKKPFALKEAILPMNRQFGFLGTAKDKSHELLDKAVGHIKKAAAEHKHFKVDDKVIGHYLDSKGGRHLADMMTDKVPDEMIHRTLKNSIGEFSKTYNPSLFESFLDYGSLSETYEIRFNHGVHADDYKDYKVKANDKNSAIDAAIVKHRKLYPHHTPDMLKNNAKVLVSESSLQEQDPHLTKVYAAAQTVDGRFAAAKRKEADAKARAEYLAKKNGTHTAEPEKKPEKPTEAPGTGIYHPNNAKRMESHRALRAVMNKPLKASEASAKIKEHISDAKLHTDIAHFAKASPDTDMRPLVKKRMEQLRKIKGF